MAPIRFGDTTRGHRFLSKGEIKVSGFADYAAKLEAAHVRRSIRPSARRSCSAGAEKLCAEAQVSLQVRRRPARRGGRPGRMAGAAARHDRRAVHGRAARGADRLDEDASALFRDDHEATAQLANRFVVVANNVARDGGKAIVDGNERVLRARLCRRQVLLGPGPQGAPGRAAAGAEGHRLPRQARHPGRAGRAHRRASPTRSPSFVPGADAAQVDAGGATLQGRPGERHGGRVPRAAGHHGPLLCARREAAGRGGRRHRRSLCAGRAQRPLPVGAGVDRRGAGRQARCADELSGRSARSRPARAIPSRCVVPRSASSASWSRTRSACRSGSSSRPTT